MTALAPALQAWFTDRLITQRNSKPGNDRRLPRVRREALCCIPGTAGRNSKGGSWV